MTTMGTPLPFVWPYALVFWLVYVWVFAPEFAVIKRSPIGGTPAPAEDQGSVRVVAVGGSLLMLAAFILAFIAPHALLPGPRQEWFVVGIVLLVAAGLLRRHC